MAPNVDYDHIADAYDRRYRDNDYSGVESAVMAFAGERRGQHLLEVGCGTGYWLEVLAGGGIGLAGLDRSAQMLAHARTRAPRAALVQGAAERLPWVDASFDRVLCVNAFHHFADQIAVLADARRVLRPGGRMMTVGLDPHTGLDRWYIYDYFDEALEIDRRRYPASGQIRQWMRAAGFADCVTHEIQHRPVRLPARAALEQGRLEQSRTSQLGVLTEEAYRRGLVRVREAIETAEARGESLSLEADLRLYATFGTVP
jgi:SAM-dependent methyltransferase